MRVGRLNIDGNIINVALYNDGDFATYHAKITSMLIFDLNNDYVFENDFESSECYECSKPFNLTGLTFEVNYISAFGDMLILQKSDSTVHQKVVISEGMMVPNFHFVDYYGNEHSIIDFRGKYVLLDFWSSHCFFCMEDLPVLKLVYNRFNSDHFVFIRINGDGEKEVAMKTIESKNIKWMQVLDNIDNKGNARKTLNVWGEPRYFLIDTTGKIILKSPSVKRIYNKLDKIF